MNLKPKILSFHIFMVLTFLEVHVCSSFDMFKACANKYRCGKIEADYPFIGGERLDGCGNPGLKLGCEDKDKATIRIKDVKYRVLELNKESNSLVIARVDFMDGICSPKHGNTSLDNDLFEYGSGTSMDVTLVYDCPEEVRFLLPTEFECSDDDKGYVLLGNPGDNGGGACRSVVNARVALTDDLPIDNTKFNVTVFEKAMIEGFGVKYKSDSEGCEECRKSDGVCGYDAKLGLTCYCSDRRLISSVQTCSSSPEFGVQSKLPEKKSDGKGKTSTTMGLSIAGACLLGMSIVGLVVFLVRRRKKRTRAALAKSRDLSSPPSSKSDIVPSSSTKFSRSTPSGSSYTAFSKSTDVEKGSTYFGTQVFSYDELEEATDNFDRSRELGEGGFGTVYYGKLADGREVAVKRLYENNFRRVEQFMNEVEILTRLQHHNLVKLYGCTSRRSRELLLVYEFVSNGTVADHLHVKETSSGLLAKLSWSVRLSIAAETAEALAYLHRSDIIHRDVKTNNILLDAEFRVKVADFGLSKLFPNDVTHVSTAPQGTPGYVDPEYYQCYQLTTKSDVYSFGVVLIEIISSLQAVDTNRHRHDINLANMAVNKVQNHLIGELVDPSLGFDRDEAVRKMATDVAELAFRCLQQERDMRPSMEEVLAALRAIQKEEPPQKPDVVDITSDDVGLLKNLPPPLSPDSDATGKWPASDSTTPNSY